MDDDEKLHPHYSPTHDVILEKIKNIEDRLDKVATDEEIDKMFRNRAQGILSMFQYIGFLNAIGMIVGFILYLKK